MTREAGGGRVTHAKATKRPFYVDPLHKGIVRGGFFDEMGGILVGMHAQWVCHALNSHDDLLEACKVGFTTIWAMRARLCKPITDDERRAVALLDERLDVLKAAIAKAEPAKAEERR